MQVQVQVQVLMHQFFFRLQHRGGAADWGLYLQSCRSGK